MENMNTIISLQKLAQIFTKVCRGFKSEQLSKLEEELLKLYPSEESEVLVSADYSEEKNSVGLSIYVSKPLSQENLSKLEWDRLMLEYLLRADVRKLPPVYECLERMERKTPEKYELDFIPVFYTEEIDKHDIHFRIIPE
ncbi:MAG: hypothetical protein H7A25_20045 [Leptospiraceae bacterium]|nr:hypothetical protein [Leptospiraceae bacterium]MCP5502201.1 hypothetical protein [Leptospiraceae bacterium]